MSSDKVGITGGFGMRLVIGSESSFTETTIDRGGTGTCAASRMSVRRGVYSLVDEDMMRFEVRRSG